MAPKGGQVKLKPVSQAFKDKSKPADVRSSNINAAKGMPIRINLFFLYYLSLNVIKIRLFLII